MAHYAFLDENNIVTEVITGVNENITQIDTDGTEIGGSGEAWESFYGNFRNQVCKRTSYNSFAGKKRNPETNELTEETGFRKNFAQIGYTYNLELDAFISPSPYPSWVLNEETCSWDAPTPMPVVENKAYSWSEDDLSWQEIVIE